MPSKRRHLIWTTKSEIHASEMSKELSYTNNLKVDKSYEKSWWNHLRSTREFMLIYFNEKKSNCLVWNRKRLLKFVVMDLEVLIDESWFLKVLSSFGEHFYAYAVKVEITPNFPAKTSSRQVWRRSWIDLRCFLISYKVHVVPGSAWFIIPDAQWS